MNWKYDHNANNLLKALGIDDTVKNLFINLGSKIQMNESIKTDSEFVEKLLIEIDKNTDLLIKPQSIFNVGFIMGQFLLSKNLAEREEESIIDIVNIEEINKFYNEGGNDF